MEQIIKDYPLSELTHSLRLALAVRETKKRKVKNTTSGVKTNDTDEPTNENNNAASTVSSSLSSTFNTHLSSLTP